MLLKNVSFKRRTKEKKNFLGPSFSFIVILPWAVVMCWHFKAPLKSALCVAGRRASGTRRKLSPRFITRKLFPLSKVSTKHGLKSYHLYSILHEMTGWKSFALFSSFLCLIHFLCKSQCRFSVSFFFFFQNKQNCLVKSPEMPRSPWRECAAELCESVEDAQ